MKRSIEKSAPLSSRVRVPGSKSLTNRALVLGMLTEGDVVVESPLDCDDSRYMLEAIRKLGFRVEGSLRERVVIGDRVSMYADELELFVGNAGTVMRFLTGTLPFVPGRYRLSGEARMHERPIGDLVDALTRLDAEIEYAEREGYPPLSIRGRLMRGGGVVTVDGSLSSQFVSALMMAGASLPGGMTIRVIDPVSRPYITLTAGIIEEFGGAVRGDGETIRVSGPLTAGSYVVEGDYSSASYWIAAAIATRGRVSIEGLRRDSGQGDSRFLELARDLGASVTWDESVVTVEGNGPLSGGELDFSDIPDLVPTLAAIAPLAAEPIEIVNVGNLRIKESDRLAALESELRKLGASVVTTEDSIRIEPGWNDDAVTIDPHGDHRIAMAFAIAGLARGGITIENARVVGKSYPGFWRALDELV